MPVVDDCGLELEAGPTTSWSVGTSGRSMLTMTLVEGGAGTGTMVGLTSMVEGAGTATGTMRTGADEGEEGAAKDIDPEVLGAGTVVGTANAESEGESRLGVPLALTA